MYYIHFNDGGWTGYKTRSFDAAIKECGDMTLPANVNKLTGNRFFVMFCNTATSENIFMKRRPA